MWITQLFPLMRVWLHYLYQDLYCIPSSHFSLDPGEWPTIHRYLNDELKFISRPPNSGIPVGSSIISVRHNAVSNKQELSNLRIPIDKRVWLRLRDPSSDKRTLRADSIRILERFRQWLAFLPPQRPLRPKPYWPGEAAADACASGSTCQIGGFIRRPSGRQLWFSERFHHDDFQTVSIDLDPNMQKGISSFETLAQVGLVWLAAHTFPGFRMPIVLKSVSDNTGAESVGNKLFCTTKPLCFFVEVLAILATVSCVELDIGHIPGKHNTIADDLSRWSFDGPIPHGFVASERIRFSLADLWKCSHQCSLHPKDAYLLWSLPT